MPRHRTTRRLSLAILQPVLSALVRRNRSARELTAALHIPCSVCRASLSTHFGPRNKWTGCRKGGAQ